MASKDAPRRTAVNTLIFSVATGLSRIAGLIREIVAARYFGTSGAASAFTLAFQIPNLIRALVADAALSSAFVPVFSELLENKKQREAYQLASALGRAAAGRPDADHARLHPDRALADPALHG